MKRFLYTAAIILSAGCLSAEDSLRLPSSANPSQVHTLGDQVEVKWPYGTVTMPAPSAPADLAAPGVSAHPRAWNHGLFKIRYELSRDGEFLRARHVRITVENKTSFRQDESDALKTHEAMHRRINETEARRMERELSAFRYKASGSSSDLKQANTLFRQAFHDRVGEVDKLHKEWDKNQIP